MVTVGQSLFLLNGCYGSFAARRNRQQSAKRGCSRSLHDKSVIHGLVYLFNEELAPAVAEKKLDTVSGTS